MNYNFKCNKNIDLIKFLVDNSFSKNRVKSLVKYKCVTVNDALVLKLPFYLNVGDVVKININRDNIDFKIIYEDSNYLIVDKTNSLLTISTSKSLKSNEDTLYKRVRSYLNQKNEFAFIVNRIDKETSGLVVFVKKEKLKSKLQNNWNNIVKTRKYIAIVCGKINKDGRIDNYLYEDKRTFSHSTKFGGKRAITNYRVIKYNDKYSLLDINIETGRKNQIRVHMSEMKHPIVGDKKYYSKDNSLGRLMLHHYELSFVDPITNNLLIFKSEIPDDFFRLFNNN